jgi:glycosyltransferase involved in cell wall biosynthesis
MVEFGQVLATKQLQHAAHGLYATRFSATAVGAKGSQSTNAGASLPEPVRITVAMVTYNAAGTLERALRSVLRHRSKALELVVMDGGSTDGTLDILRRYESGLARWHSERDDGIYDAMNKVLQIATGDWLLFLGADDELLTSPEEILSRMSRPEAVYYGDVRIRSSNARSGGRFSKYRLMQQNICHQAVLYPKSVYRHKRYDTASGMLADHRYNIELRGSGVAFIYLDEVISRFDDSGRSSVPDPRFERIKLTAIRESFGLPLYVIKRARTAVVRLLKSHDVSA